MTENPLTPYMFDDDPVRVVMRDTGPWFVAADVCRAIGIRNNRDAVASLDDDEKDVALTDTPGGRQEVIIINESGLYTLTLRSRRAVTQGTVQHRFRKWVTSEVIPSVRKTGGYGRIAPRPGTVAVSETELRLLQTLEGTNRRFLETQARLFEELREKQAQEAATRIARNLILHTGLSNAEIGREAELPPEYVAYIRATMD